MCCIKVRLLSTNSKANDLTETILKVINDKKPQSVKQLTTMLKENLEIEEKEIIKSVLKLQAEGIIKLENQASPQSLATYLKNRDAIWYWMTIAAGALTAVLVFTISENVYPWFYVRNVLGVIFVLFLPGYAFIEALFPASIPAEKSTGNIDTIERIVLSIALSIALIAIVGLLLNFSPWGLNLTAMILSLLAFTLVFATVAVARKYNIKRET
jgi:hypothetical protein